MDQEQEAAREAEGVPDDEGWIKVTRISRNKVAAAANSRKESRDKRTKRKLKKRNQEKVKRPVMFINVLR